VSNELRIEIFADGADLDALARLAQDARIKGFTTNPSLMRKAGVTDYEAFAREALKVIGSRPISFEVLADNFDEMEDQALRIGSWAPNVVVKVPISNTRQEPADRLLIRLAERGVRLNVTALMTLDQVRRAAIALASCPFGYVSVFAGRIADTGRDPVPLMAQAVSILAPYPNLKLIWASPREVLTVVQADAVGCHVITATSDILAKLSLLGKDLAGYSLETVQMFFADAVAAGYQLRPAVANREQIGARLATSGESASTEDSSW
jgi:transaldolase